MKKNCQPCNQTQTKKKIEKKTRQGLNQKYMCRKKHLFATKLQFDLLDIMSTDGSATDAATDWKSCFTMN